MAVTPVAVRHGRVQAPLAGGEDPPRATGHDTEADAEEPRARVPAVPRPAPDALDPTVTATRMAVTEHRG